MSKVIAARISNELYQKIIEDGRSITEILRDSLVEYYSEPSQENNDNATFTGVNKEIFENKYQELTKLIDEHLEAENEDND